MDVLAAFFFLGTGRLMKRATLFSSLLHLPPDIRIFPKDSASVTCSGGQKGLFLALHFAGYHEAV